MKGKYIVILAIILIYSLVVSGCGAEPVPDDTADEPVELDETEQAEDEPDDSYITVTDMAGQEVQVPVDVKRVSTLCGCAHRFLVHLEASEMITGVRESEKREPLRSPWNMAMVPEIFDIPIVSGEDAETIIVVEPELMVANQAADGFDFFEHEDLAEKVGIPLLILRPYVSFSAHKDNVFESYRILGEAIGRRDRAGELVSGIEALIDDLDARTASIPEEEKPSVYVGGKAWGGSMGLNSTSSMYSAFDFINAKNVAAELGEENVSIDSEALLSWDPDYIFLESTGFDQAFEELQGPEFETLTAVQDNNIYRIHPKIWTNTNHETVLVNTYFIGSVIYPEQFADLDFTETADQIYTLFLGKTVLQEMIEVHGDYERVAVE